MEREHGENHDENYIVSRFYNLSNFIFWPSFKSLACATIVPAFSQLMIQTAFVDGLGASALGKAYFRNKSPT